MTAGTVGPHAVVLTLCIAIGYPQSRLNGIQIQRGRKPQKPRGWQPPWKTMELHTQCRTWTLI